MAFNFCDKNGQTLDYWLDKYAANCKDDVISDIRTDGKLKEVPENVFVYMRHNYISDHALLAGEVFSIQRHEQRFDTGEYLWYTVELFSVGDNTTNRYLMLAKNNGDIANIFTHVQSLLQ
ncbi:hypothetical protein [Treponema endosymbiont of Eucomonympha sp.]|uniref:hypothetical protein n=1 Tax=Treponema endosymbiont of Eucomonympha sp. TaxID=1580831 RepID=UPI00075073C4|nr:hypothetical protein [Treponema endosymbiont of Eucomonympha sp.]